MSDREGFLSRWSRRKHERAARRSDDEPRDRAEDTAMPEANTSDPALPAIDPADLRSIECITEETDIRAFLTSGVAPELARAALRRAWTADPQIRDFVGLADYDWDFNACEPLAGFGPLEPSDEIRRQAAQLTRRRADQDGHGRTSDPTASKANALSSVSVPDGAPIESESPRSSGESRSRPLAMDEPRKVVDDLSPMVPRKHGRALPT